MEHTTNVIRPVFITIDGKKTALLDGPVEKSQAQEVIGELTMRWRHFAGHSATNMDSDKLFRMENLRVQDGRLLFEIERHACTMNGSKRADVHTWAVDLASSSAVIVKETCRQLQPTAKPYTKADARKDAQAVLRILTGRRKNRGEIAHSHNGDAVIHASTFASLGEVERTRVGRRQQFIDALHQVLPLRGWHVADAERWSDKITLRKTDP